MTSKVDYDAESTTMSHESTAHESWVCGLSKCIPSVVVFKYSVWVKVVLLGFDSRLVPISLAIFVGC